MKLFGLTACLLIALSEGRRGSSGSRPSGGSKPSGSKPSGSYGSSSSASKPSRPTYTTSSGNKYSYKGVSSAMKSSGWSSKAKTAAAAYVAYRASKKLRSRRPKLWTGYGYEGDEWEDYSPISNCFSCVSYNGGNMACERPDDSFLISALQQVTCNDNTHYCGFTMGGYGEEGDNVFIQVNSCLLKSFSSVKLSVVALPKPSTIKVNV